VNKIKKAVFPVGGLGTRFLPATKSLPKEMLPVASKPLIQHAFEEAQEAGIEEFIFITGRNKSAINNHFDHAYELERVLSDQAKAETLAMTSDWLPEAGNVVFVRQRFPQGLGHAVWCARHLIRENESFAVLLADELFIPERKEGLLKQMVDAHAEYGGNVIGVADIDIENSRKYGMVKQKAEPTGNSDVISIEGMIEKPEPKDSPSSISIAGRYILDGSIMSYLDVKNIGKNGEVQLTDALCSMLAAGHKFFGLNFHGKRLDCGSPLGLLEASIEFALADSQTRDGMKKLLKDIGGRIG
jgi:UTP-glucose-1-phosphate uridylyltransferase